MQTLHGAFPSPVQRFQYPHSGAAPTYLELTEQLCEGSISAHLAEFSAYKPMVLVFGKLHNNIGILQTKFRYREGHETRRGGP